MSDFLFDALGMSEVPDDPTDIPLGTYDGDIFQSNLVITDGNDQYPDPSLTHAVTFRSLDGGRKTQWFNLGKNPVDANGQPTKDVNQLAGFESTMSDKAKSYYKQMWIKLGFPGPRKDVQVLNGLAITFRVYPGQGGRKNATVESLRTPDSNGPSPSGGDVVVPF